MATNDKITDVYRVAGDLTEAQWMRWRRFRKRTKRKSVQTVTDAVLEYLDNHENIGE